MKVLIMLKNNLLKDLIKQLMDLIKVLMDLKKVLKDLVVCLEIRKLKFDKSIICFNILIYKIILLS